MKKLLLFSCLVLIISNSYSQSCLRNAEIFFMYRNQVPDRVILTKIQNADCCFSLTPVDLVELTKEAIYETIINRMIYIMERRDMQRAYSNRVVARPRVQMLFRTPRIQIRGNF